MLTCRVSCTHVQCIPQIEEQIILGHAGERRVNMGSKLPRVPHVCSMLPYFTSMFVPFLQVPTEDQVPLVTLDHQASPAVMGNQGPKGTEEETEHPATLVGSTFLSFTLSILGLYSFGHFQKQLKSIYSFKVFGNIYTFINISQFILT